jgi:DNA-binding SARP family transcriptional activator/TolB-like protein
MQAQNSAGRSVLPRARKTRAVLAALALAESRPLLRTCLTGLLWSRRGKQQAQASLRQCVHELQQTVSRCGVGLLHADRHHLVLHQNRLWVDALELTRATVAHPQGLGFFQRTILDDLAGLDPAFDRWRAEVHQRMAQLARSVAEDVLAAQCETNATISAAEQLLHIDSIHESAWQMLIRAHVDRGDRAAAIATFERCTAVLANAGLTPSIDIEELAPRGISTRRLIPGPSISSGLTVGRKPSGPAALVRPPDKTNGVRLVVLPARPLDGSSDGDLPLGLAEEITIALANFRWISCIASTSLAVADGRPKLTDRLWHQLDVDFLLDSTIQRVGNRIRIIGRLVDVRAGGKNCVGSSI